MPKIGAHVSSSKSLDLAFDRAKEMGAECFQIFIGPPQMWVKVKLTDEVIEKFKIKSKETKIGPNFIHACYLNSLGTEKSEHLKKSIDWLTHSLEVSEKCGIAGVIFHAGSHKGRGFETIFNQLTQAIKEILKNSPKGPFLIMEISAGSGGGITPKLEELGKIIKEVDNSSFKICIDTQHAFAAGYPINTKEGLEKFLKDFEREIGLSNLAVIHANDSKTECGSNRDRHENIGEGLIGNSGFENILNHPKLKNIPFILEVPGIENQGPDSENVKRLKALVKS